MSYVARSPARPAQHPLDVVVGHWLAETTTLHVLAAFNAGDPISGLRCLLGDLGAFGLTVGDLALGGNGQGFMAFNRLGMHAG